MKRGQAYSRCECHLKGKEPTKPFPKLYKNPIVGALNGSPRLVAIKIHKRLHGYFPSLTGDGTMHGFQTCTLEFHFPARNKTKSSLTDDPRENGFAQVKRLFIYLSGVVSYIKKTH